jgi:sugar phosphate isomerase/epimerase
MIPTISQVCTLNALLATDIADYAAGHCASIELWLTKLEDFLQRQGPEELMRLRESQGVSFPAASYQGGLLDTRDLRRDAAWELFERRLQLCRVCQIPMLIVACDVLEPLSYELRLWVRDSLRQVAERAGAAGMRVALEFQAQSTWGNNLQTAVAMVADVAHPALGICLDTFHFEVGPSKLTDLGYLTGDNLFHVQVSDLADTARELASDSDRIMPGDGDLSWEPIVGRLRDIGYAGCVSLELMNPQLWQIPPRQLGEIGMTALRKLLGQAAMQ